MLGYCIGGGLSCNRRYTGGLLLGNCCGVPVEKLSDCNHARHCGGGVFTFLFLAGNSLQARIAADYVLYGMMNAYSVSIACMPFIMCLWCMCGV